MITTSTKLLSIQRCVRNTKIIERYNSHGRRRSPYAILNLKTSATLAEIKNSFRKLAKVYHPDLSTLPTSVAQDKMAEIVQAYDQLRKDDVIGARAGDSRVALACQMFTLEELQSDNFHNVYKIRILYMDDFKNDQSRSHSIQEISSPSLEWHLEIRAHPDDSVSDLKRQIQDFHGNDWGLMDRRLDREAIRIGWELACLSKSIPMDEFDSNADEDLTVMSNHFFLKDYAVHHGQILYAIVRK
jgi:curved DNA-binding protein CbpA